jgi:hypothetical protein
MSFVAIRAILTVAKNCSFIKFKKKKKKKEVINILTAATYILALGLFSWAKKIYMT